MSNRPAGHKVLEKFLHELAQGVVPQTATTQEIAAAFVKILGGADPAAALRLKLRRGQKAGPTARAVAEKYRPIWRFMESHIIKHGAKRGALASAKRAATTRFGKDARTIDRIWKIYEPWRIVEQLLRSDAWVKELNRPDRTGSKYFVMRQK